MPAPRAVFCARIFVPSESPLVCDAGSTRATSGLVGLLGRPHVFLRAHLYLYLDLCSGSACIVVDLVSLHVFFA